MVTTIFIKKNGWSTTRKVHVHLQMYLIWHCLNLKLHSQTSKPFGIIDDREPRLQNLGLRHVTEEFLEDLNPPFGGNNFIITSNSTQMSINFDLSLDPRSSQKKSRVRDWELRIGDQVLRDWQLWTQSVSIPFLWAHCSSCVYAVIWLPTNA